MGGPRPEQVRATPLTPRMALHIEKVFGPDTDHPFCVQFADDVAETRQHARDISTKRYAPAASHASRPSEGRISWARHEQA